MIIVNGRVALRGHPQEEKVDIRVRDGHFVELGSGLKAEAGEEVLDAAGLLVLPGAIDPHVHFDTPGFDTRESFLRGCAEAAKGGVTTIIDMPCTSVPPVISMKALETKLSVVSKQALVDYGFYGGVRGGREGDELERGMAEIADKVLGFKCYLLSGMESFPRVNHEELGRALVAAAALNRPLLLHAEDADYVGAATKRIKAAREAVREPLTDAGSKPTWDDYVDSRPESAELVACAVAVSLAQERACASTLHVVHVGTSAAAEALGRSGASCETCTQYLAFSREDFAIHGSALKTAPPVKRVEEKERLWALLAAGAIPFVTSDHAPSTMAEKRSGSVWTDYGGIPGTGTLLPFMLSEGYLSGRLSLPRFLEAVSSAAAERYGIADRKGSIAVGKDADFILVDTEATTTIRAEELYSKGRDTPFEGMILQGCIRATYVRGQKVYDGDLAAKRKPAVITGATGTAAVTETGAAPPSKPWPSDKDELVAMAPGIVAEPGSGRFLMRRPT